MPFGLLRYGLGGKYPAQRHFTPEKDPKKSYDVVIIGGGGHGLDDEADAAHGGRVGLGPHARQLPGIAKRVGHERREPEARGTVLAEADAQVGSQLAQ